jgi:hypothetical protein
MQKYKKQFLVVTLWLMLFPGLTTAAMIDLNDFFFFPGDPVVVSADGSTATISEDPFFTPIMLTNDPFLGDPEVILAGLGISLVFEFNFIEGAGFEADEFGAFIIDPLTGGSLGAGFEFFTTETGSGEISFDLTSLLGTTGLGLQFLLSALPGDAGIGSMVTIGNVRLEQNISAVPLPGAFYLFATGIIGLWRIKAIKQKNS